MTLGQRLALGVACTAMLFVRSLDFVSAQAPAPARPAAPAPAQAAAPPHAPARAAAEPGPKLSCDATVAKALAGTWKAPEWSLKRSGGSGSEVFGPNAKDVRNVDLTLDASGAGTLKITTSVVDQKGKSWAPTEIETKITVGAGQMSAAGRCEPAVTVTSAVERFLDATKYQTALEGTHVMMLAGPAANQLEVRFEPPKGDGSFWTTMRRQVGTAPARR